MAVDESRAGRAGQCPHCRKVIQAPPLKVAEVEPESAMTLSGASFDFDEAEKSAATPQSESMTQLADASKRQSVRRTPPPQKGRKKRKGKTGVAIPHGDSSKKTSTVIIAVSVVACIGAGLYVGWSTGQTGTASLPPNPRPVKINREQPPTVKEKVNELAKENEAEQQQKRREMIRVNFLSIKWSETGSTLGFEFKNSTGKNLDSFKGNIRVFDQFGDFLDSLVVRHDTPVKQDDVFNVTEVFAITPRARDLLEKRAKDIKIVFEPEVIIYEGGERDEFQWSTGK
jgi:hypothetical protein